MFEKNLLFVAHDASLFGANQSLINMISSLKDEDVSIKVVFPEKGPICQQFDLLGIEYLVIKFKGEGIDPRNDGIKVKFLNLLRQLNKILLNALALRKLRKLVRMHNITIVHSNSSVIGIGEELAKMENIRHVWHLREYIDLDHGMAVLGGIDKLKDRIRKSDKVICISEGVKRHFDVGENSIVLYNSVRKDSKGFITRPKGNYFLFCGSLVESKGVEDAIRAFYKVNQVNTAFKLLIAGSGEYRYEQYLKNLTVQLNINEKVEYLGFREDTDDLMSNAIALLMCSHNEALGRVTIEAMLNSCVVIGFNNAGTAEIINNGLTGFLYNSVEELSACMIAIASERIDGLDDIRLNAFNYAKNNFLEKQYSKRLINYYNSFN